MNNLVILHESEGDMTAVCRNSDVVCGVFSFAL